MGVVVHVAALDGDAGGHRQDKEQFPHQMRCEDGVDLIVGPRKFDQPPVRPRQTRPIGTLLLVLQALEHDLLGRRQTKGAIGKRSRAGRVGQWSNRVLSAFKTQRDAIQLRFAAGLTAREIGGVLGISEAAAQKQVERGMQALKEAYRAD